MNDFLISHDRLLCVKILAIYQENCACSVQLTQHYIARLQHCVLCWYCRYYYSLHPEPTSSVSPAGLHYRVAQHGPDQSVYTLVRTWRHCAARGAWSAQDGTSASGPAPATTSRERGPCKHRKKQFGVLGIFGNTNAVLIYINIHLSISTTISVTICRIFIVPTIYLLHFITSRISNRRIEIEGDIDWRPRSVQERPSDSDYWFLACKSWLPGQRGM